MKNLKTKDYAKVEFHRRGWSANSFFKCFASIYSSDNKERYKIIGDWSKEFILENCATGEKETIWRKTPYHEKVDHMYGMTPFGINMNYFPKRLQRKVAPTDSRRRPD